MSSSKKSLLVWSFFFVQAFCCFFLLSSENVQELDPLVTRIERHRGPPSSTSLCDTLEFGDEKLVVLQSELGLFGSGWHPPFCPFW